MFNKIKDKFLDFTNRVTVTDSFSLVVRDNRGNTKIIRDADDERELAIDFNEDKIEENYTIKKRPKRIIDKQELEVLVANRFLPIFNSHNGGQFKISPNQPLMDDHVDVVIIELNTKEKIDLQIRVSDDAPWKELHKHKYFERHGEGFETHHNAIKKAIASKLKYPISLRQKTILLLDGWLGVRTEDLESFIESEVEFLESTHYKEIWFVGGLSETIVRLFKNKIIGKLV